MFYKNLSKCISFKIFSCIMIRKLKEISNQVVMNMEGIVMNELKKEYLNYLERTTGKRNNCIVSFFRKANDYEVENNIEIENFKMIHFLYYFPCFLFFLL